MITVNVFGIGFTIKDELDDTSITVLEALKKVCLKNNCDVKDLIDEHTVYICNGKRAFLDDLLTDNDCLTVTAILGGG